MSFYLAEVLQNKAVQNFSNLQSGHIEHKTEVMGVVQELLMAHNRVDVVFPGVVDQILDSGSLGGFAQI